MILHSKEKNQFSKMKTKLIEQVKICANHIIDKGLVY